MLSLTLAITSLLAVANGLSYKEAVALNDPSLTTYHERTFNIGFHAAMSLGIVYGILTSLLTMLSIVVRQLVRMGLVEKRKRE